MKASLALEELKGYGKKSRVSDLARFYKTGPGEYAEGDLFLGGTVPQTRSVANSYKNLELVEVQKLFNSPFHEARLCAAIILNLQFKAAKSSQERKRIFDFYLKQVRAERINNWDIVDVSAPWMGVYLTRGRRSHAVADQVLQVKVPMAATRFDHPYLCFDQSRRFRANNHHFGSITQR
jgi:hypothetical protein